MFVFLWVCSARIMPYFVLFCLAILAVGSLYPLGVRKTPGRPFAGLFGLDELEYLFQRHILVFVPQEIELYFIVCQTFDKDISEDIVGVIHVIATGWAGYSELADAGLATEASPKTANCLVSILSHVTQLDSGDHGILLSNSKLLYSFQYVIHCFISQ